MTRAGTTFAVLALTAQIGCTTHARRRVDPSVYREHPSTLVGKTIAFQTATGTRETLLVLSIEGTMLAGYRTTEAAGSYREEDKVLVDVREIPEFEVLQVPTASEVFDAAYQFLQLTALAAGFVVLLVLVL